MSMILALATLSDANIQRVLEDPPLIWKVVAPDDPEIYEDERKKLGASGLKRLLSKLFGKPATLADLEFGDGESIETDLDKAWHGIHFLLTGTAWEGAHPLNFLVAGGRQVGEIEVGYGPARVYSARETQEINSALAAISEDELRLRFRPEEMLGKEIYPEIWDRPCEEDDTIGYLLEYYRILRGYLAQTSESGMGIVVSLT